MDEASSLTQSTPTIPQDAWVVISSYVEQPYSLSLVSHELQLICQHEAKKRLFKRCGVVEIHPKSNSYDADFLKLLALPKGSCSIIPCIRVPLSGAIDTRLLFVQDGQATNLIFEFERVSKSCADNHIFAVICDHTVETTLEPSAVFRGMFYKRCGITVYETETPIHNMKRIEVQLRGVFNGKLRLFGFPFIIVVPRICDRDFVHRAVWRRLAPFIKNSEDQPLPPYNLVAYNINVDGHWNEVAFTPDYMVVDSQMHAVGEKFTLIVDFGNRAPDLVKFDLFGDLNETEDNVNATRAFVPMKGVRMVARLLERDYGVRMA